MKEKLLFICAKGILHKLDFSEIVFIEIIDGCVTIQLKNKNKILTGITIHKLLGQLIDGGFMRVNKSFIVQVSKIQTIKNKKVIVDGTEISLEKAYAQDVVLAFRRKVEIEIKAILESYISEDYFPIAK